ncbi:MAG: peptidase U34 [Clostridia bacterium]|nr:peptidase U34 [Clostridia bacterium]
MCDTLWQKKDGFSIFLKNSDRAANEPNLCVFFPAEKARGEVECTYIKIPDKKKHYAALLVKPSWTWGAEMGVNEFGVCVGNEAVFTKTKTKKIQSLIGMDFVRLALERSKTARIAVDEIISLLKEFGQGGNCGFDHEFYYDNSYLISDKNEAYILETAGRDYAVKKAENCANISNRLSLDENVSDSSIKAHFTRRFFEPIFTFFSGSKNRMKIGSEKLKEIEKYDLSNYFNILRQHATNQKKCIHKGSVRSICMHAGFLGDHTTGSMLASMKDDFITVWITGSSTPCLSIFKPLYFDRLESFVVPPCFTDEASSLDYWLKREKFNRAIYGGLVNLDDWLKAARELEREFIEGDNKLKNKNATLEKLIEFSAKCSKKEEKLINKFTSEYLAKNTSVKEINLEQLKLPNFWAKRTKKLGQNVFERKLSDRIK